MNDAALTTGFARRLRNELPRAFDQINAQLALQFARQERGMETEWHVEFLQSTHADDDDAEGTLDAVLVPARQSLERHLESAQADLRRDKKHGLSHARKLLSAALPLHHTLALILGQDHSEVIEFGDHIAGAALACSVMGYNTTMEAAGDEAGTTKTANADAFVSVLNDILPLATDPELTERIRANLKTARTNHVFDSQVRPLMDRLLAISKLPTTPEAKLNSIYREILPKLDALLAARVVPSEQINELCDNVAMLIRGLGIEANNSRSQPGVAAAAITTALKYVRDKELRVKLVEDQSTLTTNFYIAAFDGFTIEFADDKSGWSSRRAPVHSDGTFTITLSAERKVRNHYRITLRNARGEAQKISPDALHYTIGAAVEEQPIIHSIGVGLLNNAV